MVERWHAPVQGAQAQSGTRRAGAAAGNEELSSVEFGRWEGEGVGGVVN